MLHSTQMQVESALLFETPEEIVLRVFRTIKPRTAPPQIRVQFCRFANANSLVRLEGDRLEVRITDLLASAPAPIIESLAFILLSKLYRKPVPELYQECYRFYLNRGDVRAQIQTLRRTRGRKRHTGPEGTAYHLGEVFAYLNERYFEGKLECPDLGWSRQAARSMLGHYDPSHHAIVISRILDQESVPRLALEYVLFHEMLHIVHPVEHHGARRCVHTRDFQQAEKRFAGLDRAKEILKSLT